MFDFLRALARRLGLPLPGTPRYPTGVASTGADFYTKSPALVYSVSGRNQGASTAYVAVVDTDVALEAGAALVDREGDRQVIKVAAGDDWSFPFPGGWHCKQGLWIANSSTENTYTAQAEALLWRVTSDALPDDLRKGR